MDDKYLIELIQSVKNVATEIKLLREQQSHVYAEQQNRQPPPELKTLTEIMGRLSNRGESHV